MNLALWIVQGLLAVGFALAGVMKTTQPLAQLGAKMAWVAAMPPWLVRFIGAAELAAAVGLILPSVTRIAPKLTPLAAAGLVVVMVLAAGVHATHAEWNNLPVNVVLGGLAAFVAWGRFKQKPIESR